MKKEYQKKILADKKDFYIKNLVLISTFFFIEESVKYLCYRSGLEVRNMSDITREEAFELLRKYNQDLFHAVISFLCQSLVFFLHFKKKLTRILSLCALLYKAAQASLISSSQAFIASSVIV